MILLHIRYYMLKRSHMIYILLYFLCIFSQVLTGNKVSEDP